MEPPKEEITAEEKEIYDRQIRIWGHSVQARIKGAHVAVVGITGLSAEIIKNIALSGVGELTMIDFCPVKHCDVDSNFLLQGETSAARGLTEQIVDYVRSLNPFVKVHHRDIDDIDSLDTALECPSPVSLVLFARPLEHPQAYHKVRQVCNESEPALPYLAADVAGLRGAAVLDFIQYSHTTPEGHVVTVDYPCTQAVLEIVKVNTKPRKVLSTPVLQSFIDIANERVDKDNILAEHTGIYPAFTCSIFGSVVSQAVIQYLGRDPKNSAPADGANVLLCDGDVVSNETHPAHHG